MIAVNRSGIQCTIQDGGRFGYRHLGVPISGWMDEKSATLANLLLGNNQNDAVIEIGLVGPELFFEVDTYVALTGAFKHITLNDSQVKYNCMIKIKSGDSLNIKSGSEGFWTYLGVKGGILNESQLGSRSSYLKAGLGLPSLNKNERIPILNSRNIGTTITRSRIHIQNNISSNSIRVLKGPEFGMLSMQQISILFEKSFCIGNRSDRMAYSLEGEKVNFQTERNIITSSVCPGTIQLPPSGIPLVLMKDAQTTGGYPRILQLPLEEIPGLAQKRIGEYIKLELMTLE